ncbi:MAG: P1 family peptidase [Pseudomonadota bacterium]
MTQGAGGTPVKVRPGPHDSLRDIAGLKVGQAADARVRSGVTVILPDIPCVMAVDVRGGGPGTRETEALDPTCLVHQFHALALAGGSVFGLDAAGAVADWLSARGRGLDLGPRAVPVVPAAILFDLNNGGDKDWGSQSPYGALAREACNSAAYDFAQGPVGAAFGANAGARQGGMGSASAMLENGLIVAALVAVNSFGEVLTRPPAEDIPLPKAPLVGLNTTIGLVATNARLDKASAKRLAMMAHDGLARAIRPVHTPFDGDTLFALATANWARPVAPLDLTVMGTMAADCVARAVLKAVEPAGHWQTGSKA